MSPIIYTPHDCEKPEAETVNGSLWQCPECDRIWQLRLTPIAGGLRTLMEWVVKADPRLGKVLREHTRAQQHNPYEQEEA